MWVTLTTCATLSKKRDANSSYGSSMRVEEKLVSKQLLLSYADHKLTRPENEPEILAFCYLDTVSMVLGVM